ncbi:MAG: hypothetical protein HUJ55_07320 [Ileibacterium sp.]|nr:hypothetical protein [Ileibacterium sp.]
MVREMNKNEFMRALRGYQNAQEMYEMNYPKECLLELKPVLRLLEKYETQTRFLAKAYYLKSQALGQLNKSREQLRVLDQALQILEHIEDDTDLKNTILTERNALMM